MCLCEERDKFQPYVDEAVSDAATKAGNATADCLKLVNTEVFKAQFHLVDCQDAGGNSSKNIADKFKAGIEAGLGCNRYTGYCLKDLLRVKA